MLTETDEGDGERICRAHWSTRWSTLNRTLSCAALRRRRERMTQRIEAVPATAGEAAKAPASASKGGGLPVNPAPIKIR